MKFVIPLLLLLGLPGCFPALGASADPEGEEREQLLALIRRHEAADVYTRQYVESLQEENHTLRLQAHYRQEDATKTQQSLTATCEQLSAQVERLARQPVPTVDMSAERATLRQIASEMRQAMQSAQPQKPHAHDASCATCARLLEDRELERRRADGLMKAANMAPDVRLPPPNPGAPLPLKKK